MAEVIVPADGQLAVIDELDAQMGSLGVAGKIPNPIVDAFIRVLPAGGYDRDLVTTVPTIIIESFARDDDDLAANNLRMAVAYLQAAGRSGSLGGVVCYGVRIISDVSNLPLESLPTHSRYSATISAALRGSVV